MNIEKGRKIYVHQIEGKRSVDATELNAGDGAKIDNQERISLANQGEINVTALVFDLP